MFTEYVDIKRPSWDGPTLAALLQRLHDSGYQGLMHEVHDVVARHTNAQGDRELAGALTRAEEFADILLPPAQPHARIILHLRHADLLRIIVAARSQHEARLVATALKLHIEAVVGRLGELIADEGGRASLTRFRRDVLPALRLAPNGEAPDVRSTLVSQLLRAMGQRPQVRGRPTVLASQLGTLVPDTPADQVREALEHMVAEGSVERWHVVICRDSSQWLGSSPNAEEMRVFAALSMNCPHCGRPVNDEQADVAYRLGERLQATVTDNLWICDLVETALRRFGVEAVAVHPGSGPVDGAACYQGSVILFRAAEGKVDIGDLMRLKEQGRRLESDGWRVFPLLIADRPLGLDTSGVGVTVVESMAALDGTLDQLLRSARAASLTTLLPPLLRLPSVRLADLLPTE